MKPRVDPLEFFKLLKWIDGRPLLETMEPFRQRLFREFFMTMQNGRPSYNLGLFGRGKKNWKSADLVLAAFYMNLTTDSAHGAQCFLYANDSDQANDDLDLAKKIYRANKSLHGDLIMRKHSLERRDGSGSIEIQSRDAIGSHGKTFAFCGFDELHGYKDWSLLEALQLDPSRPEAVIWIASYAGYDQREGSPLWDLYSAGLAGRDPHMLFSWYDGDNANPGALVTSEYLTQQKGRLPDWIFRRLHRNEWGSGLGGLWTLDEWDRCVDPELYPLLPTRETPIFIGADASVKRDRCAVVGVYLDNNRIKLAFTKFWQPSPDQPLDFEMTLEAFLHEAHAKYSIRKVNYDPHQLHRSMTTLENAGLPVEEYPQSIPRLETMAQTLYDAVKTRSLVLFRDEPMRAEAGYAVGHITRNERFYISKDKSSHKIDQIVALAMAAQGAVSEPAFNEGIPPPWSGGKRDMAIHVTREAPMNDPNAEESLVWGSGTSATGIDWNKSNW